MEKYTYEYTTEEERQNIIGQHPDLILVEEQNLLLPRPGKFLIFTDTPPVENQLQDIQNNTDMILLKQEGII